MYLMLFCVIFVMLTDKVREANGCVLVHCLAGISRSPTVAIAYVMRVLGMTSDDAYRLLVNCEKFRMTSHVTILPLLCITYL